MVALARVLPWFLGAAALLAQTQGQQDAVDPDPARRFFDDGPVVHVAITLDPLDRDKLRQRPREYVPATIRIDRDRTGWADVGIKLKGAAGSFRKIDDRPGFTVNLGKFGGTERFHGLRRFHLNNGRQDPTRLCEWLGHEIFAAAGYPAPRVGHARVWLDGEDLGLYVLREGFDEQFLMRVFGSTNGSLYDGGFCQDIDRPLEKDAGEGPDDHSDLVRLRQACADFDPERTTRLESVLDVDRFIDFMVVEAMLGHWDGYSQNRNNFRLWCAAEPGASCFLPHGMDQLFGDADASVLKHPSAIVAGVVQQHPVWRRLYRDRLKALLPLLRPGPLVRRIRARAAVLQKELKKVDRDAAARHKQAVTGLVARVEARYRSLEKQQKAPEPEPLAFRGGDGVMLERWNAAGETDHIGLQRRSYRGTPALQIVCDSRGDEERRGAFRTSVLLAAGRYRLCAVARCDDVEPSGSANGKVQGGVRLVVDRASSASLAGDSKWTELQCEFEVTEFRRNVELRLELRALDGKAWFRTDSLRLERVE
ncbi:MAG: CotH kinase family protein [Planctomycetes bacterium]|nr:CotH kinase family protein [Planctomycetota bacterium]